LNLSALRRAILEMSYFDFNNAKASSPLDQVSVFQPIFSLFLDGVMKAVAPSLQFINVSTAASLSTSIKMLKKMPGAKRHESKTANAMPVTVSAAAIL
jgi:hypothetical protein